MMKKTSYKTNSWWNHRVSNNTMNPNRNIDTWEDKKQDAYLKKLEDKLGTHEKQQEWLKNVRKTGY